MSSASFSCTIVQVWRRTRHAERLASPRDQSTVPNCRSIERQTPRQCLVLRHTCTIVHENEALDIHGSRYQERSLMFRHTTFWYASGCRRVFLEEIEQIRVPQQAKDFVLMPKGNLCADGHCPLKTEQKKLRASRKKTKSFFRHRKNQGNVRRQGACTRAAWQAGPEFVRRNDQNVE